MGVYIKLLKARLALQARELKKSGHNKFAGYKYFELGDFLPAINEIMASVGLCGIVSFGRELATLTITDTEDNSVIHLTSPMSTAALKGCHEVQNLGAVQTYIRRYLWVSAFEIVEHDALDSSQPLEEKPKKKGLDGPITPTTGAGDGIDANTRDELNALADEIVMAGSNGDYQLAADTYYGLTDNEFKVYVWSVLGPHSALRRKIKEHSPHNKVAA